MADGTESGYRLQLLGPTADTPVLRIVCEAAVPFEGRPFWFFNRCRHLAQLTERNRWFQPSKCAGNSYNRVNYVFHTFVQTDVCTLTSSKRLVLPPRKGLGQGVDGVI